MAGVAIDEGDEGGLPSMALTEAAWVFIVGTATDGDCGLDFVCQMLSRPQLLEQRVFLRQGTSDYLTARMATTWMQ